MNGLDLLLYKYERFTLFPLIQKAYDIEQVENI